MHRRDDGRGPLRLHDHAAFLRHAEGRTEQRLRCDGAEANDDARLHERDLVGEPRKTRTDFGARRRFV